MFEQPPDIKTRTVMVMYLDGPMACVLPLQTRGKPGIGISMADEGPGIADVEAALQDHFSTQGTLGLGLPGVKRIVDDFNLTSELGKGTRVDATVWL